MYSLASENVCLAHFSSTINGNCKGCNCLLRKRLGKMARGFAERARLTPAQKAVRDKDKAIKLLDSFYLDTGETFGEHRPYCDGCPHCEAYRQIRRKAFNNDLGVAGIPIFQLILLRSSSMVERTIGDYYPNDHQAIYLRDGSFDKLVYVFLQIQGFKDEDIEKYFGIKGGPWNQFKKFNFGSNWGKREVREHYLMKLGPAAIDKWMKTHPDLVEKVDYSSLPPESIN